MLTIAGNDQALGGDPALDIGRTQTIFHTVQGARDCSLELKLVARFSVLRRKIGMILLYINFIEIIVCMLLRRERSQHSALKTSGKSSQDTAELSVVDGHFQE